MSCVKYTIKAHSFESRAFDYINNQIKLNHMTEFTTRDFYLACLIIAEGYELKDHIREKGFTLFIFENSQELQNIVNRFYSLKYQIEPIKYSQAIRSLKGIIHSSVSTSNQVINNVKQYKEQLQS